MNDKVTASLDRIRALHAAATPGPWKANKDGTIDGDNYAEVICRGQVECMSYCYGGTPSTPDGADAEHIASWHPAVALAVARWLEDESYAPETDLGDGITTGGPRMEALAVATAYLGAEVSAS